MDENQYSVPEEFFEFPRKRCCRRGLPLGLLGLLTAALWAGLLTLLLLWHWDTMRNVRQLEVAAAQNVSRISKELQSHLSEQLAQKYQGCARTPSWTEKAEGTSRFRALPEPGQTLGGSEQHQVPELEREAHGLGVTGKAEGRAGEAAGADPGVQRLCVQRMPRAVGQLPAEVLLLWRGAQAVAPGPVQLRRPGRAAGQHSQPGAAGLPDQTCQKGGHLDWTPRPGYRGAVSLDGWELRGLQQLAAGGAQQRGPR
ncbi:low affinity immunoglobulin epsilon Fc receptor isoform X3 [Octodon degus]|uniref:low affinity immunoglobulin epsilon Fc receptor isoform X3 n=1 Tax=Octodon degus TaxID=10160 RepID=UPI000C9F0AB0|nr:low affinity immunoglobulin epsilon Fc receptor isoform X3 [Octodon degus]